jgi:hypothetical protein
MSKLTKSKKESATKVSNICCHSRVVGSIHEIFLSSDRWDNKEDHWSD